MLLVPCMMTSEATMRVMLAVISVLDRNWLTTKASACSTDMPALMNSCIRVDENTSRRKSMSASVARVTRRHYATRKRHLPPTYFRRIDLTKRCGLPFPWNEPAPCPLRPGIYSAEC